MPRIRTHARHAGFSIIELMIAIVLGALVVAGLVNVLIANRQAYHLQEANNYNQQNMRFAMDRIGWSLRMADFWGGVPGAKVSGVPGIPAGPGLCTATWALDAATAVYGYDGSAGMPAGLAGCINGANYVSGTDILILRYADTDALEPAATPTPGKAYLQVQTGNHGVLFTGARPASPPIGTPGVSDYPYAVEMFYLRPCSDPGAGGICSGLSDGGNPIPTLMRMRLDDSGVLINEPVVEGIEQLQFEYGIRASASSVGVVQYLSATAMTAADWNNVIAVRVGYVLRAQTRDVSQPHIFDSNSTMPTDASFPARLSNDCEYTVDPAGAVTFPILATNCANFDKTTGALDGHAQQFTRVEMTSVAQLRNRVR